MSKKISKVFTLLILVITMLSVTASAFALGCPNVTNHERRYESHVDTNIIYSSISNSTHTKKTVVYYICQMCGPYLGSYASRTTISESHRLIGTNKGHVGNTKFHKWNDKCRLCSYDRTYNYSCPGATGACRTPY